MNKKTKIEQVIVLNILYSQKDIHVNIFFNFEILLIYTKLHFHQ